MGQKLYTGYRQPGEGETADRGEVVVQEDDGRSRPLNPRFDLRRHADAINWGYGGSGPAQLALALAADVLGDDDRARDVYQKLKFKITAALPRDGWTLSEEQLHSAITQIEEERDRGHDR